MSQSTAILLFSRTAQADAGKFRRTSAGRNPASIRASSTPSKEVKAVSRLIERVEGLCRQTGLPYFRSSEWDQCGTDFGHRLAQAMQSVFDRGYRHLIVVGNDCPHLSAADLRKSKTLLHKGHSMLGPDCRGGVYLLALHAHQFDADRFAGLPWQSAELFDSLSRLFPDARRGRSLRDLNGIGDIRLLRQLPGPGHLLAQLVALLLKQPCLSPICGPSSLAGIRLTFVSDRGPPAGTF